MISLDLIQPTARPGTGGWIKGETLGIRTVGPNVPASYPHTRVVNVTGVDTTGVMDSAPIIQAACRAASPGDIVTLPPTGAGFLRCNSVINLAANNVKSHITLTGTLGPNGELLTKVKCFGASGAMFVNLGASSTYQWTWPDTQSSVVSESTASKGLSQITVANPSRFAANKMVKMTAEADEAHGMLSVYGYPRGHGYMAMIRSINPGAGTLTLENPTYEDYSGLNPRACCVMYQGGASIPTHAEYTGIENLEIDMQNMPSSIAIWFSQCYSCWIKNLVVRKSNTYHLYMADCLQCEISGCDFLDLNNGIETAGHAIASMNSITGCLFENNICSVGFPGLEQNGNCCGNAYLFNYFRAGTTPIVTQHQWGGAYNLVEGNIAYFLQADGLHGGEWKDTVSRNWLTGKGKNETGNVTTLGLCRFTRYYNFIANLIGHVGCTTAATADPDTAYPGRAKMSFGNAYMGSTYIPGTSASIANGDPQVDLLLTGTIIAAPDANTCTIAFDHGLGMLSTTAAGPLAGTSLLCTRYAHLRWVDGNGVRQDRYTGANSKFSPTAPTGASVVSLDSDTTATMFFDGGAAMPPIGTSVRVWPADNNFGEKDLDCYPTYDGGTTLMKGNYDFVLGRVAPEQALAEGETVPPSYVYESRPGWYPTDPAQFPWPPFDPSSVNGDPDVASLPAGYRFVNGRQAPPEPTTPTAPSGLSALATGISTVLLTWTDNSSNEDGFRVYRDGQLIESLAVGSTTFTDTGLDPGVVYTYTVRATNASGESGSSNSASATTETIPVGPTPILRSARVPLFPVRGQ